MLTIDWMSFNVDNWLLLMSVSYLLVVYLLLYVFIIGDLLPLIAIGYLSVIVLFPFDTWFGNEYSFSVISLYFET